MFVAGQYRRRQGPRDPARMPILRDVGGAAALRRRRLPRARAGDTTSGEAETGTSWKYYTYHLS